MARRAERRARRLRRSARNQAALARVPSWIRNPRGHWLLLALCAFVVAVVLLFQGVATHTVGSSTEPRPEPGAAAPLLHERPILQAVGDRLVSIQPPPGRRVALTFDDGPDPKWTPRIAAVLHRAHVPATFFVVGSQAARYPEILKKLVAQGNEIGNHTFTHTAITEGPVWQRELQLQLTEAVLAGELGRYARFVRPPYSATPDAVTPHQEQALARLLGRRYLLALADFDGEDWQRPGVASIVRHASPPGTTGGIVLLHDGGGNRSETVAATAQLIVSLRARGFRFVTLSELAGQQAALVMPPASGTDHTRGRLFEAAVGVAFTLTDVFSIVLLAIGALLALRAVLLVAMAARHTRGYRRGVKSAFETPPAVAVIVPAYNEEVGIERSVRSLAASTYPGLEIVVVDDGSTDGTADVVAGLDLDRLTLVRQDNAGKAAALNTGVAFTEADIIVMVDGDTLFEPETVERLVAPLVDPQVGAVSGNTKVGNRRGLLGRWQHIEYVMGFNLDRRMYEVLQCTPTVPGAIGAFRRGVLEEVGGVPGDTLAEDTDLTLAIGRTGRQVVYAEDARAWTEAPATLSTLWRQRYRWSFGTMQAVWKHRGALLTRDRRQRRIGRRALPYMFTFQIVLPILAPLIDLFALYGILFTDPVDVLIAWLAFNAIQIGVAVYAFRLDHESLRPLWALPLQQFVYRQLMYLVIIESTVSAIQGVRSGWKHLPRTGDVVVGADAAP
jgi:cellulose synthase/poly-beta-1,6-N-acetylglucosamine synthase-like glycosyltransferase/peptidoglycan/xylan/chitin deacetylase (PgdA/CDA1 family)